MKESVFDFSDYKRYLTMRVGPKTQRRGIKSSMAKALGCQSTYVSQVLNGAANFSLEQAESLNGFFGHSKDEAHFFLLLVQKARAGSSNLESYFQEQIDQALQRRLVLTKRLGGSSHLSAEDQGVYYSSWHYGALHMAITIPELQTREALANYFRLPMKKVNQVLDFLAATGLARQEGQRYLVGENFIRLGNDSPHIVRHHTNWRQQAIGSLEREELSDLHYSAVFTISKKDMLKLKDKLLEAVKENADLIRASKEEELACLCLDLFGLKS